LPYQDSTSPVSALIKRSQDGGSHLKSSVSESGGWATLRRFWYGLKPLRVPLDKNEGIVKQHLSPIGAVKHRVAARVVEDRSSESLAVNQFPAVVPPTIDTA